MSSLDSAVSTNHHPINPPTTIIFECNDLKRDTGLLLVKRKDPNKFEIHLYNDYASNAIAMVLSIEDLELMFESLEEYFIKAQIESYD